MPNADGHPSRQRPESVRTVVGTTIPLAEAALRLGITAEAVRKRIQRGKLDGHKTDDGWLVVWTGPDNRPESVPTAIQGDAPLVAALRGHVAALEADVAYLREQLDHSRRELAAERERFDVIHRAALGRIEALTAGDRQHDPTDGVSQPSRNGNAAPGASDDAATRVVVAQDGRGGAPQGLGASAGDGAQKPPGRAWWHRLFGGG
jgi:hypothetical protein